MSAEHDGFLDAVITNPLTMESDKRICREIKDRIATLEAERDAARADANFRTGQLTASRRHCEEATIERDRAVRALTRSGWTLTEGADEWKPPIGLRPDFEEIDRLRDALAKKQRAIDEAYDSYRIPLLRTFVNAEVAHKMANILRPHATPTPVGNG